MNFRITILAILMLVITSCNSNRKNTEINDKNQVIDSHTSKNALDWNGIYQGTLPCADCEGI